LAARFAVRSVIAAAPRRDGAAWKHLPNQTPVVHGFPDGLPTGHPLAMVLAGRGSVGGARRHIDLVGRW